MSPQLSPLKDLALEDREKRLIEIAEKSEPGGAEDFARIVKDMADDLFAKWTDEPPPRRK